MSSTHLARSGPPTQAGPPAPASAGAGGPVGDDTATVITRATRRRKKPLWVRALPWATTIALIAFVELLSRLGVFPEEVPSFTSVVGAALEVIPTPEFLESLWATLEQFAVGLAIGVVIGVALGVALGTIPLLYQLLHYVLDFMRFIPAVVYLPLLLLVMGARPGVAYILAAVGAVWPMLFQTYYGVVGIPQILKDTGRVFGLTSAQRLRHVVIPSVSPFLATGLRIAAAHALVVVVAVEIITTVIGLGRDIAVYSSNGIYPEMYALVGVVGILGLLINWGLESLERWQLHWHSSYREVTA